MMDNALNPLGKKIRNMARFTQIAKIFARHGFYSILEILGIQNRLSAEQFREVEKSRLNESQSSINGVDLGIMAIRLRQAFEELGPAFIKLGQLLATREDLFPKPFILEFRKLHASVTPLSFAQVRAVIEAELSEEQLSKIVSIHETPIASGSIGQVHFVELMDGQRIVLKIQRPGIEKSISGDLALMEYLAALIDRYFPDLRMAQPRVIAEEFSRVTLSELDFIREAGSTTKISANFSGNPNIVIPDVKWEMTSKRVLALEYVSGYSLFSDKELAEHGISPELLVERGLEAFLQMVFVDGYFHGDLHPGNLIACAESRVGLIDFGVAIKISRVTRERLAGLLVAFVEEDYDSLVSRFAEMSNLRPEFDLERFEHEVTNALAPFVGLSLREMKSGQLLWEIARIAANNGAPLPRELVLFLRTLVAFEGAGSSLNPNFDMIATCQKFTGRLVGEMYSVENLQRQGLAIARDFASVARTTPRQFRGIIKALLNGELVFNANSDDLVGLSRSLDRSSSRLAVSLIIGALLVASSILIVGQAGETYKNFSLVGLTGFALAGVLGLYIVISILFNRGNRF